MQHRQKLVNLPLNMELTKNFEHQQAENKWYNHWLQKKYFKSSSHDNREPYTIVMPPPNVTGILHMGHCLNNTIQDILIRRARMLGKNACWVPGTDHASIATEAKVVQMLREQGTSKSSLSREEFLNYAWKWKEKFGGIILQQLRKLGCSADWDRTTFTMDPDYYDSVIDVFIDLYNKGYIYRGRRMINWDPQAKTALSDEEVIRKEVKSKLYFVRYHLADQTGSPIPFSPLGSARAGTDGAVGIVIATVRPETILGDTAIAVNPNDERYKHLLQRSPDGHGRFAFVPLINRRIPIIADEYVEMDFGTGALKITPAHDKNDYQIGEKHGLEIVDTMNDDGTMSEAAQRYIGEDRFEVRKKIVRELEAEGHLVKVEDYVNQVGFSERTDVPIEDRLSLQWWVDMKKLYKPALDAVVSDEIKFYPVKFKNLYRNWMENIRDWCISRQLWWGHRIPAWYDEQGNFVVAKTKEEAIELFNSEFRIQNSELTQDEDVMDTWFSSWLWPFEVFKGYSHPGNPDIKYYYPTNTLVTAPEIIFFWVARMIMAGFEYRHEKPFSEVYFTGIVRDELGRKMSKQLGNSPDLLGLIEKYGADAVRFGTMISSPAGNDLLFDVKEESTLKQGSYFINKIWNALKLVKSWRLRVASESGVQSSASGVDTGKSTHNSQLTTHDFAVSWFENRLSEVKTEIENQYKDFRLSESLKTIYSLVWDDFCSWYLEWIKPGFEEPMNQEVYEKTVEFFEELMQLLHPFMPFVTEEVYHQLKERKDGDDLIVKRISEYRIQNSEVLEQGSYLKEVITSIRDARNKHQLKPKERVRLHIQTDNRSNYKGIEVILRKQVNADAIDYVAGTVTNAINIVVQKDKIFIETENQTDTTTQKEQLQKDLAYLEGFLSSVEKKLSNERFVQNAKPEIVETERKKKADAEAKIKAIKESLGLIP
jgi:valyl-tRNA synthetase